MAHSTKRKLIDKANFTVVVAVSVAAFITIFCLVSAKALWSQRSYQSRAIESREKARDQLDTNVKAATKLATAYEAFAASQENIIGGSATGSGDRDGDNARIILDALPSKYDFPALATSLEKLAKGQNLTLEGITGTDDEAKQQKAVLSPVPKPVDVPFKIHVSGNYDSIQSLIGVFERSIRPFVINQFKFEAEQGTNVSLSIDAKTYYQPEKTLQFKSEVVK